MTCQWEENIIFLRNMCKKFAIIINTTIRGLNATLGPALEDWFSACALRHSLEMTIISPHTR